MLSNYEAKVRRNFEEGTSLSLIMDIITGLMRGRVPELEKFDEDADYLRQNFEAVFQKAYWFKPHIKVTMKDQVVIDKYHIECPCDVEITLVEDMAYTCAFADLPHHFNDIIKRLRGFNVSFKVELTVATCKENHVHKSL